MLIVRKDQAGLHVVPIRWPKDMADTDYGPISRAIKKHFRGNRDDESRIVSRLPPKMALTKIAVDAGLPVPYPDHLKLTRSNMDGSLVYFISDGDAAPVKIGFTKHTAFVQRVTDLQVGNHRKLRVLAAIEGGLTKEHELHAYFAPEHLRGEWYTRSGRLQDFINGVRG